MLVSTAIGGSIHSLIGQLYACPRLTALQVVARWLILQPACLCTAVQLSERDMQTLMQVADIDMDGKIGLQVNTLMADAVTSSCNM